MNFMYADHYLMEELMLGIVTGLTSSIPSVAFSIAMYVLTSLALQSAASRRGISKPWLSWIPVVNVWVLGSLSDQYRYVTQGQIKSKRKALLVLNILNAVLSILICVICGVMVVELVSGAFYGSYEEQLLGPVIAVLGLTLPLIGVYIAFIVIRYMALYDVYKSMDPANHVVFIVLSILVSVTEPFFLFFNRNKDDGMPPRKVEPTYMPCNEQPYQQEYYQQGNRDYL